MTNILIRTPAEPQLFDQISGHYQSLGVDSTRGHFVQAPREAFREYGETLEEALKKFRDRITARR